MSTIYLLFDSPNTHKALRPFTYTKSIADFRVGIITLKEKWERMTQTVAKDIHTLFYLEKKYKTTTATLSRTSKRYCNASYIPTDFLYKQIQKLPQNTILCYGDCIVSVHTTLDISIELFDSVAALCAFDASLQQQQLEVNETQDVISIQNTWDIFAKNAQLIQFDLDYVVDLSSYRQL